jgi:hypothetical protein
MNEPKLEIFAAALSSTKLRHSLSLVRVCESMFPSEKAQEIFDKHLFSLEVVGEEKIEKLS